MANRRMFSLKIIDTDNFLEMPISARELYFQFGMRADDDGFVGNPKRIMKMIGASDDDIKVLIAKRFIIPFENGVCVISDWKIHNYIQSDRYQETQYKQEKKQLKEDTNGRYLLENEQCIQNGYSLDTQVRLGKVRLGKDKELAEQAPLPSKILKEKTEIQKFVEFYKEEFAKINDVPPVISFGKVGKLFNSHLKDLGIERLKKLLLVYLATDDPFYVKNGYSLDLFFSTSTLHALSVNN